MRRLYTQIAGGVILAVIVGWTAVALFLPQLRTLMEQSLADQLLGSGLRAVGGRLDATTEEMWPSVLAQAQHEITLPLSIVERDAIPPDAATRGDLPTVARAGDASRASLYIPLRDRRHFLVAGPLEQPPVAPLAVVAIVFVLVLTVTASAFVGIPLVRRLRTIRDALVKLGGGNWGTRLDANAKGALSELAESVNDMATQLQHQFQEREALLQAVSHEIGTPLSRMRFRLELLEQGATSPEQRKRLSALATDLSELDELSSELTSWMETDAPQRRSTFDVVPVLESLVELECAPAGRTLTAALKASQAPVRIHADPRQFQRAMENLLRNAVRYASSVITVEVSQGGENVAIEIRDDGPGIPPQDRSRVLEPFARSEVQPSRAHRGLGLGLAIVRRIVIAHGGTLTVGEAPKGGASLRTTWPQADDPGLKE